VISKGNQLKRIVVIFLEQYSGKKLFGDIVDVFSLMEYFQMFL
jgi:hypothetical protein